MQIMEKNHTLLIDNGTISSDDISSAFNNSNVIVIKAAQSQHLAVDLQNDELKKLSSGTKKFVLLTSGSTGTPKGVVLTIEKLMQSAKLFSQWSQITPASRLLCLAPISSMSGLRAHYGIALLTKCHLINPDSDASIFSLLTLIENQHVTHIIAGPPFIKQLAMLLSRINPQSLSSLQYILCTGANIDNVAVSKIYQTLKVKTLNYYGLTESYGFCIAVKPDDFNCDDTAIGKAVSGVRLEIIKPDKNNIGSLRIHSRRLFDQYLGQEKHDKTFLDTGDFARIDNAGNVYLHGRVDNALKLSSTELIYPIKLEEMLSSALTGNQVIIYALPSGYGAWIESPLSLLDVTQSLKSALPGKYIPNEIKVVADLSLSPLGKIKAINEEANV
tara:strand:- start:9085 stop:10245 length:1161 start_codon:yes stop_codon:yes gene_type:complete